VHIIKAQEMMEGSGVTVRRLFPFYRDRLVADPFVLWDDFSIGEGAGFPTHAHRGFEAITYLFSGSMNHADNLGNDSTVKPGGAQRFTAGKGIEHSEMPGSDGVTTGIQLWINLPQSMKQIDPGYQQVNAEDIPQQVINGVTVREIVGGHSPVQLKTPVRYAEIRMTQGSEYTIDVDNGMQGIIYLQNGNININDQQLSAGDAMQVSQGEQAVLRAEESSRIMLALGKPLHETVRLSGGFVD
jgi:redox-sensitive bicupin YhaK (pirin superfamily)